MTAWWLPDDCLMTALWLPYDCLTNAWLLPNDFNTGCYMIAFSNNWNLTRCLWLFRYEISWKDWRSFPGRGLKSTELLIRSTRIVQSAVACTVSCWCSVTRHFQKGDCYQKRAPQAYEAAWSCVQPKKILFSCKRNGVIKWRFFFLMHVGRKDFEWGKLIIRHYSFYLFKPSSKWFCNFSCRFLNFNYFRNKVPILMVFFSVVIKCLYSPISM